MHEISAYCNMGQREIYIHQPQHILAVALHNDNSNEHTHISWIRISPHLMLVNSSDASFS